MRTAICLQHVPFEGPGLFAAALKDLGFELTSFLTPEQGLPPDPGDFLLVMGGPMSVNDELPWIGPELEFIRDAVERDIPYLGICLGSQLLARAFGGSVYPGPRTEIGLTPIHKTEQGQADPVLATLPDTASVFEWHGEGIHAPPGAAVLCSSDDFPVQAFRLRERAYGLLFHLEVTMDGVETLCRECPEDVVRGGKTPEDVQSEMAPHLPTMGMWAKSVVENLANLA